MKDPYRVLSALNESAVREKTRANWEYAKYTGKGIGGITSAYGHGLAFGVGINKHAAGHWEAFGIGYGAKGKNNNYWLRTGVHTNRLNVFQAKAAGGLLGAGGTAVAGAAPFIGAGFSLYWAGKAASEAYEEDGVLAGMWAGGVQFGTDAAIGVLGARALKGSLTGTKALYGELSSVGRAVMAKKAAVSGIKGYGALAGRAAASSTAAIAGTAGRGLLALGGRAAMFNIYAAPIIATAMYVNHVVSSAKRDIETGHRSLGINTTSSLAAFNTKGAWTSRQMSVQAIQRSHLNSRSALGNEAAYMHRR